MRVPRQAVVALTLACSLALGLFGSVRHAEAKPTRAVALASVDYYRDVPTALTAGADGNVWFVAGSSVGRLTPSGDITSYVLDWRTETSDLVADEGGIWFTADRSTGRLTYDGDLTTYAAGLTADPTRLATGVDGTVWFAGDSGRVGTISQSGVIAEHTIRTAADASYLQTNDLEVAADGSAWLSESEPQAGGRDTYVSLVRVDDTGTVLARLPRLGSDEGYRLPSLVRGSDGAVWFLRTRVVNSTQTGIVGRLVGSAQAASFSHPATGQLATGPDGAIWFSLARTDLQTDPTVGRLTVTGDYTAYDPPSFVGFRQTGEALIGGPGDLLWGTTGLGIASVTIAGAAGQKFEAPVANGYWPSLTPLATTVRVRFFPVSPLPGQLAATSYLLELQPGDRRLTAGVESAEITGLQTGFSYQLQARGRNGDLIGLPRTSIVTTQPQRAADPAADFTGDGRAEIAVFRPSNGTWYVRGHGHVVYGEPGDIPVAADYTGDGKADLAVWRPSTGTWYVRGRGHAVYGRSGDIPVPADYTGDGKADLAVWRPSTGTWFVYGRAGVRYGTTGDIPVPGNFLGDRRADFVVWRPSTGDWYLRGGPRIRYGVLGNRPLVLDRDGDGRNEVAVYDPESDTWSIDGIGFEFGLNNKGLPIPGPFDVQRGDALLTFCPWNGRWETPAGLVTYGENGDIPV